tara:strand:+ start:3408 stop:4277 length:870 start_codon:yes stop_codon:yes gene_type:complete
MYNILFHVSGIAILEICFYFYYIGPMETKLFEKVVGRLGNELVNVVEDNIVLTNYDLSNNITRSLESRSSIIQEINEIDKRQLNNLDNQNIILENSITNKEAALALNNINTIDVITQLFTNDQNSTALNDEYMNSLRNNAKKRRKEKNETLFIQIVEYWSILAGVSIFVYLLQHKYKIYKKLKKENGIVPVTSEERDLEMQEVVRYRKGSDTEENLRQEMNDNNYTLCTATCMQRIGYIGQYIVFGGCIIGFQYLFFENVVLKYDPLSIDEVKYLLYIKFKPIIKLLGY